jgi:hypothetical protein
MSSRNGTIHVEGNADPSVSDVGYGRMFWNPSNKIFQQIDEDSVVTDLSAGVSSDTVILVKQKSDFGTIDSTKVYLVDSVIDMNGPAIEIPAGGINVIGYTFDVSKLVKTDNSSDMFVSASGGSGNILSKDIGYEASGTNSQVWNLTDATGFNAFEFERINYNNCTKVGTITNYRQGLELGTGRFGGTPTLELIGTWVGGYRITTSIVRELDSGMTDPLFMAGAGFTMASRFLTDINCDLPTNAAFADFTPSNFPNPSTLQVKGAIMTRDGVTNSEDTNIFPNISAGDLPSDWSGNKGMGNTFVGGSLSTSAEIETSISTVDVYEDLLATWSSEDLQHFDSPSSGKLRHLGDDPRNFRCTFHLVLEGGANDEFEISFLKDDSVTPVSVFSQKRVINNFQGGRDVAYFGATFNLTLDSGDTLITQVRNLTDTTNCTLELSSSFTVEER